MRVVSRERLRVEYVLYHYIFEKEIVPLKASCLDEADFDWYDTDARALTPEEKKPSSFFPAFFKESIRNREILLRRSSSEFEWRLEFGIKWERKHPQRGVKLTKWTWPSFTMWSSSYESSQDKNFV